MLGQLYSLGLGSQASWDIALYRKQVGKPWAKAGQCCLLPETIAVQLVKTG